MTRVFVVQDLHIWNKNLTNRKNYIGECLLNFKAVENLVRDSRLENKQDKIYVVFLGDIFHKGFGDDSLSFNLWTQKFQMLRAICNGIYLVVGNHEISFKEKNPFWSLINEIKSKKLSKYNVECFGALPVANLQDYLDIGDFRLHFCHYGTEINNLLDNQNNILFSHDYWMTDNMFSSLEKLGGEQLQRKYLHYNKITDNSILKNFRACFFGHMHRFQSIFKVLWEDENESETILYHLGSLGLTNREEVKMTGNTRIIPEILLDSDIKIIEHKINIPSGIELLKHEVVKKQEVKYEETKERKLSKQEVVNTMGNDPINYIEQELKEQNELEKLDIFNSLEVEGGLPEWLEIIMQRA